MPLFQTIFHPIYSPNYIMDTSTLVSTSISTSIENSKKFLIKNRNESKITATRIFGLNIKMFDS